MADNNELVTFTPVGWEELAKRFENANTNIYSHMRASFKKMAKPVEVALKARTPKRTGKLRNKTATQILGHGFDLRLEARQNLFSYSSAGKKHNVGMGVRLGTRRHQILPVRRKMIAFPVNGVTVFARKVNHPGNKPNPYNVKAIQDVSPKLNQITKDEIDKVVQELAG